MIQTDLLREGVAYADQWIGYQQQLREIPGVVIAVWHDDALVCAKGYGFADIENQIPMTPAHIFRIASHSKTFTATAIMRLVEAGKVRLDDPLAAHISWLDPAGAIGRVTVRQALNHAGGIIRDGYDADYWQLYRPFPDIDGLRSLVETGGDTLPVNDTFKYSNIGYSLLGLVVESTSGRPYNDYVRAEIVDRLGLRDTGPETNAHAHERLVTAYTRKLLDFPLSSIPDVETGAMSAATGFYSTAIDLCRYASVHFLGNDELLNDTSKREMQQPYWTVEGADQRYGLGFAIQDVGDRRLVGHGGSFPGHATRTWFDPNDRLAVVVLTNQTGAPAALLAGGIVKIIDLALDRSEATPVQSAHLEQFTSRFINGWGIVDVARFGGTLVSLNPDEDDPAKNATELDVVDETTLRISTKTNGYGSPGETMCYERDAGGAITRVVIGGISYYPVEVYRARLAQS